MPRIRKKTSNRKSTFDRSKLKHKVAEGRKKNKKLSKKNPQWKSKHAKDPGIPNNFPFKDQILAEVAAERRRDEEEKQQQKELRKAEKAAARGEVVEKGQEEGEEDGEEDGTGFDGVSSVRASALKISSMSLSAKGKERMTVVEDEDEVPILINSEYVDMQTVLDKADIVLQVLDARDPLSYQSTHLQQHLRAKGKGKLIMVLNKIDTCPREFVHSWAATLRRNHPTYLFRSASAFLPKLEVQSTASASKADEPAPSTTDAVGLDSLLKELSSEASKKSDGPLHVALIGVANTGKSSLLNSFIRKLISPIYKLSSVPSGPSTTERPLEVTLEHDGKKINLIDTPALSWIPPADIDGGEASILRAKDVLMRNKGRIDRVKEPLVPVTDIVARANAEDLMLFYNLPAFTSGDATAFLSSLARGHGLIKRKGEANYVDAARIVLRDWSTGRIPRFAVPPAADANAKTIEGKYEDDEEILKAAPLRKEMRKGRGIVRLVSGTVETREVVLDAPWVEEEESDEDEDEGGAIGSDDEEIVSDEDVEASEDEEEEEEEEDIPPPPPTKNKRKRQEKPAPTPTPASKKVAFASHPAGSKQARAAPPALSKPAKAKVSAGPKTKKQRK